MILNLTFGFIQVSNFISYVPLTRIFLNARLVKMKIIIGNKKERITLVVILFPNSQILLSNNALINLNHLQQIQSPLNLSIQAFSRSNQS